jgi:hypothetical protein
MKNLNYTIENIASTWKEFNENRSNECKKLYIWLTKTGDFENLFDDGYYSMYFLKKENRPDINGLVKTNLSLFNYCNKYHQYGINNIELNLKRKLSEQENSYLKCTFDCFDNAKKIDDDQNCVKLCLKDKEHNMNIIVKDINNGLLNIKKTHDQLNLSF